MPKSYYMWTGVGAIEDFDGSGGIVAVDNREDAIALFSLLAVQRPGDLTMWERNGTTAILLAARFGGTVILFRDTAAGVNYVTRKGG